jgi:uncharacterized protein YjiS (DUF1127 family)
LVELPSGSTLKSESLQCSQQSRADRRCAKAFGFDDLIGQGPRVTSLIAGLASTIRRWVARLQQRRALREIAERNDHHLLKDIGVSQEEAFREADKPFWRR